MTKEAYLRLAVALMLGNIFNAWRFGISFLWQYNIWMTAQQRTRGRRLYWLSMNSRGGFMAPFCVSEMKNKQNKERGTSNPLNSNHVGIFVWYVAGCGH
jgi:hypothetical protein